MVIGLNESDSFVCFLSVDRGRKTFHCELGLGYYGTREMMQRYFCFFLLVANITKVSIEVRVDKISIFCSLTLPFLVFFDAISVGLLTQEALLLSARSCVTVCWMSRYMPKNAARYDQRQFQHVNCTNDCLGLFYWIFTLNSLGSYL